MNDAQLILALGRAKAQLNSRIQTVITKVYIERAEILEACFARTQEFAISHRNYAREIIEYANQKERIR